MCTFCVILFDDFQAELFEEVGGEVDGDDGDGEGDGVTQDGGVGHAALLFWITFRTTQTNHCDDL